MYNYKFDDKISENVLSSLNTNNDKIDIANLINKIIFINKNFDNVLDGSNDNFCCFNNFKSNVFNIEDFDIFSKDELEEFCVIDQEYYASINVLKFETESLMKLKLKAIKELDFVNVLKINEKMNEVKFKIDRIKSEIENIKNDLSVREQDYMVAYNDFVTEFENVESVNDVLMLKEKYGSSILNKHKRKLINSVFEECFKNKSKFQVEQVFNNSEIQNLLGKYLDYFINKYSTK